MGTSISDGHALPPPIKCFSAHECHVVFPEWALRKCLDGNVYNWYTNAVAKYNVTQVCLRALFIFNFLIVLYLMVLFVSDTGGVSGIYMLSMRNHWDL